MTQDNAPRLLYDRKTAALMLSISVRSLDYLIAANTFQTRRIGKKVLIPHGELVRFSRANHYEGVREISVDKKPSVHVTSDSLYETSEETGT